jgi:hypothetical protein
MDFLCLRQGKMPMPASGNRRYSHLILKSDYSSLAFSHPPQAGGESSGLFSSETAAK